MLIMFNSITILKAVCIYKTILCSIRLMILLEQIKKMKSPRRQIMLTIRTPKKIVLITVSTYITVKIDSLF